jgi:Fe-S oxidoreductase
VANLTEIPSLESALALPRPGSTEEEQALVARFLAGMRKCFDGNRDPVVRDRLLRAIEHPVDCARCAAACHVYQGSGRDPDHRPGLLGGVLRRIYHKYVRGGGKLSTWWHGNVELDWARIARLAQMAYSCNLCERCTQSCHTGEHALLALHLRGVFQEMGISPVAARGAEVPWIRERIRAIDEDISQRTGLKVRTPWDVEGADILLVQPAANLTDWGENAGALALLLTCAGLTWTMSSELAAEEQTRSFVADSVELLKTARRTHEIARRLQVKKIVAGESGVAFDALSAYTPRPGGDVIHIERQSAVTLIRDIVYSGLVAFDPVRNDFPVTLHDPCQLVRHGVVEPQRQVLRQLCPQFREMDPWAENNYCCGAGGGLVRIENTRPWRIEVSGRKKIEQVREAFSECMEADTPKYVCAPCGDCQKQMRDLLDEHAPWEKHRILCGGLAELVVNAMVAVPRGFLNWETR